MFDFMDMGYGEPAEVSESTGPYIPEAGDCMRCGMCVSSCPTFRLFQTDEETPRRRIRTISKLFDVLSVSDSERLHLDNCLQCRACETVCPSRMAYGQLFDQAKVKIKSTYGWLSQWGFWLIEHKRWRSRILPFLAVYLKSGLQKPLRYSGLLKKLGLAEAEDLIAKPVLQPLAACYPAASVARGRVALFAGCIAEHFDRDTLLAAIKLLNAIGYEVMVPPQQGCCGAIHLHNGLAADNLIANNLAVFNAQNVDAVLYTATGCGVMLSEYQSADSENLQTFQRRLQDINAFLLSHWPEELQLLPSSRKVAVHEPCSQRNVLKNQQTMYTLLQKIPGLNIEPLADNQSCCGAGGSYMLSHPEIAGQLRDLKRQAINAVDADHVLSSNFGCMVYLNAGNGEIFHPLLLLAKQLPG